MYAVITVIKLYSYTVVTVITVIVILCPVTTEINFKFELYI